MLQVDFSAYIIYNRYILYAESITEHGGTYVERQQKDNKTKDSDPKKDKSGIFVLSAFLYHPFEWAVR